MFDNPSNRATDGTKGAVERRTVVPVEQAIRTAKGATKFVAASVAVGLGVRLVKRTVRRWWRGR
jgi:hypothetical protein